MASTGFAADFCRSGTDFRGEGRFREGIFAALDFWDFRGFFERDFFPAGFFAARAFAFPAVPILRTI
jgi:hypothetical protein